MKKILLISSLLFSLQISTAENHLYLTAQTLNFAGPSFYLPTHVLALVDHRDFEETQKINNELFARIMFRKISNNSTNPTAEISITIHNQEPNALTRIQQDLSKLKLNNKNTIDDDTVVNLNTKGGNFTNAGIIVINNENATLYFASIGRFGLQRFLLLEYRIPFDSNTSKEQAVTELKKFMEHNIKFLHTDNPSQFNAQANEFVSNFFNKSINTDSTLAV